MRLNLKNTPTSYQKAKNKLVAKAISELCFEGLICAKQMPNDNLYCLEIENIKYTFQANAGLWDTLNVKASSIKRIGCDGVENEEICPFIFFHDYQKALGLDDITFAHFTEELHQSLFAETELIKRNASIKIEQFHKYGPVKQESLLPGHPKILLNKGRLGFNSVDFYKYSPEFGQSFQLELILIKKEKAAVYSKCTTNNYNEYLFDVFINSSKLTKLKALLISKDINIEDYLLVPTHPWQLDKIIKIQFFEEIEKHDIILIDKEFCNTIEFSPQISVRSLRSKNSNLTFDLKLSLNILNTSAYRGMSDDAIASGQAASYLLKSLFEKDNFLKNSNSHVYKEVYGVSLAQEHFSKIPTAPYRYHELLSFILRENGHPEISSIMTGTLAYIDSENNSYIGYLIKKSKIHPKKWIGIYTKKIILPLYHLQLKYGIGLVSHGQNIHMVLKDAMPDGLIIKDFQGDLRLQNPINKDLAEIFPEIETNVDLLKIKKLPANHLIHDLLTGHFVTHIRFLSQILSNEKIISEIGFYQCMTIEISKYLDQYFPEINKTHHPLSLLRIEIERIILNKVRFAMGYNDTQDRPLPMLGKSIRNPLAIDLISKIQEK